MNYVWTPEKIENLKRASEYTAFHKKLSVLAEPYLDERWTLADIGCGPGLIDAYLAPMVASIDAIDNDSVAIGDLSYNLGDVFQTSRYVADKIRPRLAAPDEISGESWDVVLMSFFGLSRKLLDSVAPLAKRRMLIFMHGRPDTIGPLAAIDDGNKFSVADMESYLNEKKFAFKKSVMEMQFGQPFKTIEDIHRFLSEYGVPADREIECIDLDAAGAFDDDAIKRMTGAEERIIKTNRFDYPYYLPKSISVALFVILVQHTARA
ncbi:MAG: class I SAM-dependent methyltransferase [Clostridiales Family XIII bacterium]|nr:class I SAM-dependent methyltransferase [Clostridiales Family XIII bacterium]